MSIEGLAWLWKHRHCWEQLKYLYEHRLELKRILRNIYIHDDRPSEYRESVDSHPKKILAYLREFDRVPLARSWKVEPPPRPRRKDDSAWGGGT